MASHNSEVAETYSFGFGFCILGLLIPTADFVIFVSFAMKWSTFTNRQYLLPRFRMD